MRELRKGVRQDEEERRGHDEPELVHGEIVVDAVQQKVQRDRPVGVGEVVVEVEEEAMKRVLEDCPDDVAGEEACGECCESWGGREGELRGCERRGGGEARKEVARRDRAVGAAIESAPGQTRPPTPRTHLSENSRIESAARNMVMGPHTMGTTYHLVRVSTSSASGPKRRAESLTCRGWCTCSR